MRNKNFLTVFLGLAFMLLVGFMLTSANVTKLKPNIYEFDVDTIGASSSGTFTISNQNKSKSGIGFEVRVAVLSGTVDSRIIIQERPMRPWIMLEANHVMATTMDNTIR